MRRRQSAHILSDTLQHSYKKGGQDRLFSGVKRPFFYGLARNNRVFPKLSLLCVSQERPSPRSHKGQNMPVWNWLRYCLKWEWLCLKREKVGRCTTPLHSWHQWWTGTVRKSGTSGRGNHQLNRGVFIFLQKSLNNVFVHNFLYHMIFDTWWWLRSDHRLWCRRN